MKSRSLTKEIIIKRSEDRYGKNRFDYSQLTYINKLLESVSSRGLRPETTHKFTSKKDPDQASRGESEVDWDLLVHNHVRYEKLDHCKSTKSFIRASLPRTPLEYLRLIVPF